MLTAALCVGCNVDDSYDLSDVGTDGVGLGTDDTEFYMPLLSVNIDPSQPLTSTEVDTSVAGVIYTKSDSSESTVDIFGNLASINAILPGRTIDLTLVASDDDYLNELIDDLMFEINEDDDKCEAFCDAIFTNEDYVELKDQIQSNDADGLGVDLNPTTNPNYAEDLQAALPASTTDALYGTAAVLKTKEITFQLIRELIIANTIEIVEAGVVDIGSESFDILNKNIDGDKNTLRLYASFETDLDIEIELTLTLIYSGDKKLSVPAYLKESFEAGETEPITGEFLETILANLQFEVSFGIKNYDPTKLIVTEGKFIKLTFIALKTGSIKLS